MVFTEGDWYTIENRLPLLEGSKEFLRKISPSFAYGLGVYYPVKAVLNYNRTMEINNTMTFEKGTTTLLVENKDTINNITPVITVDII